MDTKWRKNKKTVSFAAFVLGWTLIIVNLIPVIAVCRRIGGSLFEGPVYQYQTSSEFRGAVSDRLMRLLAVATEGKSGQFYNAVLPEYYGYIDAQETYDKILNDAALAQENMTQDVLESVEEAVAQEAVTEAEYADYQAYLEEQSRHYNEMAMAEMGLDPDDYYDDDAADYYYEYADDYADSYYGYDFSDEKSRDAYMADIAPNKNILYAVAKQGKLLYTNIESLASFAGKEDGDWQDEDLRSTFYSQGYNFILWYNQDGDGRVRIEQDRVEQDVYGDGVYRDYSPWRVPGYTNFTLGEAAEDVEIYLAAAAVPKLYMVGNSSGGVNSYGQRFYSLYQEILEVRSGLLTKGMPLLAGVFLLFLAFLLRKDRRLAVERLAGLLGKICLELKILLFLLIFTFLVCAGGTIWGQIVWWIRTGFEYYIWSGDTLYEIENFTTAGKYLAAFFWLFYLAALDLRKNRTKQKKPLFDLLKEKDFKYPIQKRLVKRDRRTLLAELVVTVLLAVSICGIYLGVIEYLNYLTGGYVYGFMEDYGGRSIMNVFLILVELAFCALFVFTLITFCSLKKNHRLAVDIGALSDQILAVREGNMTKELILPEDTDLKEAADNLNGIQKGMETALAERMKSERMKVDLVTNVSHDIKTPLTSIISYVELLRQEEDLPQYVKEYIQILGEKSERLRGIVQDVFEVSKATSGQLPIKMEVLDMGKLLRQTLADMNGQIEESTLTMKTTIPQEPVQVRADGQRLYRVFQNLIQNALRYSLEGSRVYLTLTEEAGEVVVRIKNTSSMELSDDQDFTERFVRGDKSRTDGGSGLGLSIAKSFTEACRGRFSVETDADLFTVTVRFPGVDGTASEEKQESS